MPVSKKFYNVKWINLKIDAIVPICTAPKLSCCHFLSSSCPGAPVAVGCTQHHVEMVVVHAW